MLPTGAVSLLEKDINTNATSTRLLGRFYINIKRKRKERTLRKAHPQNFENIINYLV
jgi:hypothetical protein